MALALLPELAQSPLETDPAQIMPLFVIVVAPRIKIGTDPEPEVFMTPDASFVTETKLPVFVTSRPWLDEPAVEIVPLFVIVSEFRVDDT